MIDYELGGVPSQRELMLDLKSNGSISALHRL